MVKTPCGSFAAQFHMLLVWCSGTPFEAFFCLYLNQYNGLCGITTNGCVISLEGGVDMGYNQTVLRQMKWKGG